MITKLRHTIMWHPLCDSYAIALTWVWNFSKHLYLEGGFCISFLRYNGEFHFVTREEAFSVWLILHFCSQYRAQSPFTLHVVRSELPGSKSQGKLEMEPGDQQSQNSACPPLLQQHSSWTHPVWTGGWILPLSNSWFHSLTFSLLPVIFESIHFHK